MDILIKGMKMPKNCDECRIMVFEDTNCAPELYCGCPIVFEAHPQGVGHRPDYCPLVPVPPHGDLIDRDANLMSLRKVLYSPFTDHGSIETAMLKACIKMFEEAPTIIEAEEE